MFWYNFDLISNIIDENLVLEVDNRSSTHR